MVKGAVIIPFLLLCLVMNGIHCRNKIAINTTPDELNILIRSFAAECLKRGLKVDINPASLHINFGRMDTKSASCRPYSQPKIITIDSTIWKALSPPVREMLVYHELAHCLLQ